MNVIAIDPGTVQSAICILVNRKIDYCSIVPNTEIEFILGTNSIVKNIGCEIVECFGMPVGREIFETCYLIGEIRHHCKIEKKTFYPVARREIKMHFCNSMKAKDANIRQAMIDTWGAQGTIKNKGATYGLKADMWSALAIATYTAIKHGEVINA